MSVKRTSGKRPSIPKDSTLKVGWFETAKYEDGTPVAYVASIQEYGWGPIPPRPFIRPTVKDHKKEWATLSERGAKAIIDGKKTADDVLDLLGAKVAGDVKRAISKVVSPPLSTLTILVRKEKKIGEEGQSKRDVFITATKEVKARGDDEKAAAAAAAEGRAHKARKSIYDGVKVSAKPLVDEGILIGSITWSTEE